jgi:monothiol glutaredoxin
MDDATRQKIQTLIDTHPVVVFMKGTKNFPQCGFSATVVEVMKRLGTDFHDVNVLADPAIRQGVKDFTNWPTIPQVYIGGKFVGGCDIVRDMYTSGELAPLVQEASQK